MQRFLLGFAFLLGVVVFPVAPAAGQAPFQDDPTFPEGPLGRRVQEVLDAVNSGDPGQVRQLVMESYAPAFRDEMPVEEHAGVLLDVHDRSLGLEFHSIRSYQGGDGPEGTVVVVRNRLTEAWEAMILGLEAGPPYGIVRLEFVPARPPTDLPPLHSLTLDKAVPELDRLIRRLVDAEVFSGSVLLAKDGKVLYRGAFGPAYRGFEAPNRLDTKFNLGSMNKMFTAVAVAQLVEAGKLSYEDSLSAYLDSDWLPRVDMSKVKIKHLLSHTSGLGSYFNDRYTESSRELFRAVNDYRRLVEEDTLAFLPGMDWSYSNTGFLLLGAVIEKASGQDYFEYIREHIYRPAGMKNSDCYEMDVAVPNLAIGYTRERTGDGVRWRNNLYSHVIKGGPAGGGFSTVEDLLRFADALRAGKLVTPETLEILWSPKPELQSPGYGFGFGIEPGPWGKRVGHGGGFSGISSQLDIYLDSGYTAVVLSNLDRGSFAVREKIRELLMRMEQEP